MDGTFVNLLQSAEKEFDDRKVDLRLYQRPFASRQMDRTIEDRSNAVSLHILLLDSLVRIYLCAWIRTDQRVIQWPTIFIGGYVSLWLKLCDHAIQSFTNERRTFAFWYFIIYIILFYILSVHKICRYIKKHKFFDIHEFFKNFY